MTALAEHLPAADEARLAAAPETRGPGRRPAQLLGWVLRLGVLALVLATAVQSVLVPRGLYADGSYSLWIILNIQDFVVIGPARAFTQILNQLPVVLATRLGVEDLDVLIAAHSFGVAALPILFWAAALVVHIRSTMFWVLAAVYASSFLTSGFIAIGEYNSAFGLTALVVAITTYDGRLPRKLLVPLVLASTVLVLSYEGMVFLGIPLVLLIGLRLFRTRWFNPEPATRTERWALSYALACAVTAGLVAAGTILIRMQNSADTNLAGAVDVRFALENNQQWRLAVISATVLVVSTGVRQPVVAAALRIAVGVLAIELFRESIWAPAWMHYNTRSLAAYTFTFLLLLIVALVALDGRRRATVQACGGALLADKRDDLPAEALSLPGSGADRWRAPLVRVAQLSLGAAVGILVLGTTVAFATTTHRYDLWLDNLADEVRSGSGIIEISETDLYNVDSSQFSWGWTNPYTSALLATGPDQGVVISHVDTAATYTGITPPMSPEFFERYRRAVGP